MSTHVIDYRDPFAALALVAQGETLGDHEVEAEVALVAMNTTDTLVVECDRVELAHRLRNLAADLDPTPADGPGDLAGDTVTDTDVAVLDRALYEDALVAAGGLDPEVAAEHYTDLTPLHRAQRFARTRRVLQRAIALGDELQGRQCIDLDGARAILAEVAAARRTA